MQKQKCPKCSSNDLDERMVHVYGEWGEFISTEIYKICKKCGEEIKEEK